MELRGLRNWLLRAAFTVTLWLDVVVSQSPFGGSSYNYGFDIRTFAKRQTDDIVITTRLPDINGSVGVRKDIRSIRNMPMWHLFVLCLDMMMWTDQESPLSWYQIAGIHGVPPIQYNGVSGIPAGVEEGYCTHDNILFPTWHRPYLAHIERQLWENCQRIASWFNETERLVYQAAAREFRLPYWDWSVAPSGGEGVFLPEFMSEHIPVYGPSGWQTIRNPLYSYRFHPFPKSVFKWSGFDNWTETRRAPISNAWDAPSRNNLVAESMSRRLPTLQTRLYNLYTSYNSYNAFSNKNWAITTNDSQFESIESIHDQVHMDVGQGGHMNYTPLAAFDPIFFLHHCFVDKLFAWWQVVYPSAWIEPAASTSVTFTIPAGQILTSQSPLAPFYFDTNGTFWNSDMSRETDVFGYAYEETIGSSTSAPDQATRDRVISRINQLYGQRAPFSHAKRQQTRGMKRSWFKGTRALKAFKAEDAPDLSKYSPLQDTSCPQAMKNGRYTEWLANIHVKMHALGCPFHIHVFLGAVPTDARTWAKAKNLIGSMGVFTSPGKPKGRNSDVAGTVPMTSALTKMMCAGYIESLDAKDLPQFLKQFISIRITKDHGQEVDWRTVPELRLGVDLASATVTAPKDSAEFPVWGPVVPQVKVI